MSCPRNGISAPLASQNALHSFQNVLGFLLEVEEWQRLPVVLLQEWCQKQKRPRAQSAGPRVQLSQRSGGCWGSVIS